MSNVDFFAKVLKWFRSQRAEKTRVAKNRIKEYYRNNVKFSSVEDVKSEIELFKSDSADSKEKAARKLGIIASSLWKSNKTYHEPTDVEYKWLREHVSFLHIIISSS